MSKLLRQDLIWLIIGCKTDTNGVKSYPPRRDLLLNRPVKLQSYQKIRHYSMEIQKNSGSSCMKAPPSKPLEGYFRFRQEMMQSLQPQDRTSETIIRLWNHLSQEERATRQQQSQIEMQVYQRELASWRAGQLLPVQPLEDKTNLSQSIDLQQKIQLKSEEATGTLVEIEQPQGQNKKTKVIKKLTQKKSLRKQASQAQN